MRNWPGKLEGKEWVGGGGGGGGGANQAIYLMFNCFVFSFAVLFCLSS